ncbi:MAG: cell division protein FtsQ [Ectothiorhodospiraceae bacterium]|nr:MAG: cell division protein FtsQ [Ectothiorhodospiraceae bacterium]
MPKIFIIIIFFLLSLILYISDYFVYPIDEVEITSTSSNYDNEKINDIVVSIQGQDLLSLDLSDIKRNIRSDGWIKDVEIKKSFPDKLEIIIIPQQPYAIYNSKIMMTDGTIIKASSLPPDLPIIIDHTHDSLSSMNTMILTGKLLQKIDLDIKKIEIYDSLIKVFTSTNILISDRDNYEVNLNRLVLSFQDLKKLFKRDIKSIDMRYSNGFAIK